MSADSEDETPVSVVAAIVVDDPAALPDTVEAVRRQVYEPARIVVVAGGQEARRLAEADQLPWAAHLGAVLDAVPPAVSHLWLVHDGALPRPDALGALVQGSERIGAGIAGSKILDRSDPARMLSVGLATDVFEVPYSGLETEERDQGQYDVVRDVAAVDGASMLIRRDLARGVGGPDPVMAPGAAAVDLCQRARLRGARVAVVPSSEVLAPAKRVRGKRWREDAGRIRAMIKAYGLLTLLWALPVAFVVGIVEFVLAPLTGRWRLLDFVKAWLWNLAALPDTIRQRVQARRGRSAGDDELFRFQRKGSVTLALLLGELAARIRRRLPGDDRLFLESFGRDLRQPAFISAVLAVLFMLLAVRRIWSVGLPAVGWSLPFPESGWEAALAYAGGWNPAGLGSVEPLTPFVGITGVVQSILLGDAGLAEYAFTFGFYLLGAWGIVRLLRTWSIGSAPGAVAGIVYVAGPAAQGIAATTDLGTLFALGVLPWALRVTVARWPATALGRIGRVAAAGFTIGVAALLSPLLALVPALAMATWAVVNLTDGRAWRAFGMAAVGGLIAVPLLFPWLAGADLRRFVAAGDAFWETSIVVAAAAGITALLTIVAAPARLAVVAGWGSILIAGGALGARSAELGPGRLVESASLTLVALGSAAIVGSAIEGATRVAEVAGWRRLALGVGAVASLFVVVASFVPLIGGRAGLPGDLFRQAFEFTTARPGDPAASRILVVGPPDDLPGDSREVGGAAYRVVSAPLPDHLEAVLNEPAEGDEALFLALGEVIDGRTQRAGELLAAFGIRWIVVMGETAGAEADPVSAAWLSVLGGQLDLVPLGAGLPHVTFANEEPAFRAVSTLGRVWTKAGSRYEGPVELQGRLALAENADERWGPGEWEPFGWGNEVSAGEGITTFDPIEGRRMAAAAAGMGLIALAGVAWLGRRMG